ncbi:hypothetical protein V1264_009311 [Littorina saxatilis]|uniref:TPR and ankyrin repeat-containing protein 1 n=1 Tax=Littorina saxatilis TaxID=31220 RepID=A0AAN9G1N8_9CAEN
MIADIPDVLLRVSQPHFHQILQKLAARDKWRQVEVVVDKARANDVPRGDFAKNMSVLNLVCDKGLCGAEAQRLQILNMLMSHGAQLHKTQMKEAMEAAIQHGEFRMVERLVELGVEPRCISLEMGDTPLHAALTVALDREKGNNFNLFEQLIALYEKDPKKYSYLDLACVDKDGNTLLHLAASTNYSKHSHKAVELLMSKDIPVDVMNKDGKIAIDYLKSHDRRTQYLRVAGKQTTTAPAKKKSDTSKSQEGAAAFNTEGVEEHAPNEAGDNEYVRPKKSGAEKSHTDTHTLKTKDAVTLVTNLVGELSELTPAEAKLAKSAKGKWLEMEKTVRRESIPDSDEDEEEEVKTAATAAPTASGDAQDLGFEEEEVEEEEEEEDQEVKSEEVEDPDLLTFDNLEWEVECTAEVWKTLRDHRMTYELKQRIVRSIRFLASGEWRPQLCRKVHRVPDTIKLYQAKFVKGARILWELAIAFSPRLSEAAEKRIDEDERKGEFAVRGGRMYTEIIRIWDIVFQYDKLRPAIKRIIQSHERGEHCLIRRELKGVKSQQFQGSLNKRYPMLFSEADMSKEVLSALQREEEGKLKLYPPASASEMEFHILKFYCFSSALVYNVLKNLEMKIDFPFRVTDREHAVINLSSRAPILLLGRSGTGKTTCCLYRLWSRFLTYWTKSKEMDYAPWLPRTVQYAVDDAPETKEEEDPNSDLFDGLLDDDDDDNDHSAKGATAAPPKRSTKEARAAFAQKSYSQESCSSGDSGGRRKEGGGEEGEEDEEWEDECEETVISGVEYDHLHQLFVTKNQVLCSEVQKNFRELCHADDIAHFHVDIEESAMPHKLQDIDQYKFPLFVTSRQLILMLDASLPAPHFFERNDDGSLRVTIQGWGADEEIFAFVPLEDDSDEEEEEFFDEDEEGEGREKDEGAAADHRPHKKDNRREVTYEVFAHEIWPKITKKAQVSYHPSLVWTEIISFIKGSFASLAQPKGYLDLQGYEQLGRKQAPNFTGSRDKVYGLFLKYNEYKRQHGLYDEADLVFNIYQRLRTAGPLPWVLHEVFVDETQDFTQAELTVLIRLAHNPNDMFLTGDTAQSIMRGVSFRFSDLKTLFHYAKQSLKARGKTGMLEVPRHVYQLTHNYRSHAGILSLASAVLDLLVEFFPESFDRLEKDQGLFDGPQPVVLESGSPADLAILLSGNKRKTSHIEFGAHQVILVVSEEARNSLPEELNMGLVLTIYEAKGLEFDDVLLYNFFKDSQAGKEWRVVTDFLERLSKHEVVASSNTSGLVEIDEDVLQQTGRPRPLTFDPNLHKILNSELKHLYTAVTRARVNVWIFDQDADKRAPMFEYCKARKLVKFVSMREGGDEEGVSQSMFAEKSSPEEWEKRGDEIMLRSLYDVAAKCYAMAGAAQKRNIAVAHQRALQASHLRNQPRQMRDAFLKAAILFLECHQEVALSSPTLALRFNLVMKAGRCLQNARENYLAAMVFEKNGQPEVAGQLYLRARKWIAASQCFEHVDNFGRAVKILDEQELYDQAIDCLQRYKIRKQDFEKKGLPVPKPLVDHKPEAAFMVASLSYKAAMFYHRYGEKQKMLAAIERLPNKEDQITFLQKHGYVKEAAHLMVLDGRITEAARMMLHNGEVDTATIIAEESTDSSLKAQCYWLKAQQLMAVASKKAEVAQTEATEAAKETIDPEAIQQVCKSSGCSEEEVSAALLETQGDIDKAVALLKESKKGGKKSQKKTLSSKASKKNGTEVASSDEDDDNTDDETLQKIVALLERARQQFDLCKDYSGLGECQLVLAKLRANKELLDTAFTSFSTAQPVSNTAGMLECVQMLHRIMSGKDLDLDSYRKLIWGVEKVFDVVRVLMQPATAEDKNRYQTYLTFYGLEKSGEGKLVLHPKLKPRCIRMVGSKQLFANKEEKKEERLYRSDAEVCNLLAKYLILRTKNWCREVEFYLESQLPKVIQCHSFKEGHDCEDVDFCPFLHETYTERLSEEAINILSSRVRLDHALQSGAKSLIRIDVKLSELTLSLAQQELQWNSVETLLEFIFPSGLLTYNMSRVLSFCISVAIKSPLNAGIHHQVQRYLQHLWDNPGRVGKGKSENVLKERCKSTNWIVMASLLVPLFKLDIKVNEICNELEMQLRKRRPNWVGKRYKYALLQDGRVVITLARRHLDALEYLQPSKFDPVEALIKFTKFVKLLLDRGEVSLMPDLRIFLYWMEVFSTIALCLAAKIRGNGFLVLPSCYPRALKLFNLTLPQAQRGELLQMLENYKFEKKQTLKLLHDRIEKLVWLLCGTKPSQFCLLSHLTSLKKDKSMTNLLTERALILALTLLLNIEQGNTSELCELSILRCIHGIPESKMLDMPPRLASLIDGVQAATSYQQTLDALDGTLHAMDEKLQFFQWRWNRKDCLMPVGVSNVRAGGMFRVFRLDRHLAGVGSYHDATGGAFDEIDEDHQEGTEEEEVEEELSPEEKERYEKQVMETQREEQQNKASHIITRFMRRIIFFKHLHDIERFCVRQIYRDLFSPCIITDRMCGICGVRFEKPVPEAKPETPEGEKKSEEAQEAPEEDEETVVARLKQEHLMSEEHRTTAVEFNAFKEMYRSLLSKPLNEIASFLHKHEVKKHKDTWYKDLPFQVNIVLEQLEGLQQKLGLAIQERKWTERKSLISMRNVLVAFYSEHVRGPIKRNYSLHQEMQKQKTAAREAEQQHQERLMEGMVEDSQMNEILDVVDRPLQAAGPNANASRGVAGGGANRGRGRGRGRVFRGNP